MTVYKLLWIFIGTIFIKVCFCQESLQGNPLVTNDFRSYAMNMGSTLADLLRKEISMLSKINPVITPSTSPNLFGGVPPTNNPHIPTEGVLASFPSVTLPPGEPLPAPVINPQVGRVSLPPAIPRLPISAAGLPIPIPAAGISASGGSTVYSIGSNYAPLTVINVYGDMPPNASIIVHKALQQPLANINDGPKTPQSSPDIILSNSSLSVGSSTDNSLISNAGTLPQGGCQNKTSVECKNQNGSTLSASGESHNTTNSNKLESTSSDLSEQSAGFNDSDASNTQNINETMSDTTTTVSPITTLPP